MAYSPRSMRARMSRQSATCTRESTRYLSSKRPAITLSRDPCAGFPGEALALGASLGAGGGGAVGGGGGGVVGRMRREQERGGPGGVAAGRDGVDAPRLALLVALAI